MCFIDCWCPGVPMVSRWCPGKHKCSKTQCVLNDFSVPVFWRCTSGILGAFKNQRALMILSINVQQLNVFNDFGVPVSWVSWWCLGEYKCSKTQCVLMILIINAQKHNVF